MTFPPHPPVIFGEVLFDRFPDGSAVLGGAPFNVAWNLHAFGAAPLFVSRVGDDALGERIRSAMTARGMTQRGLQSDAARPTGTVEVTIEAGEPHYDIVAERAYDFVDPQQLPDTAGAPLLYHGSLALRGSASRAALAAIKTQSGAPRFLDVNLRAPWWQAAEVAEWMAAATWVKLNEDELKALSPEAGDADELALRLLQSCGLRTLFVTRGGSGATAYRPDAPPLHVHPGDRVTVVDTVGAGDAFASVLILGLLRDWPLESTLERAQDFASAVVGQRGATVEEPAFYHRFTAEWGLS